jgi:arylsulfatase A-like enzyme
MADQQPNIVVFWWDNFGWGEVGCYGGGVLRGAPTPRIDKIAGEGLQLLNFNVEAQCTPSRSAILTGRHPIRSGTQTVPVTGGPDGLTQWEVTIARALSDAGYATGMWGKWHLGSDPENRGPVDFGFDEAVWCPRTADEVLWTMQSYFPSGTVTSAPYAGATPIPMELQPIYARKKGAGHEVIATYDAEFRAGFDRKITDWAIDFMHRSHEQGKPFYLYLPYTQVHIPTIADPEYAGKTKHGNWADILTQMDDFTGQILDTLDTLGVTGDTIVVWASDNGADTTWREVAGDPDPFGGLWTDFRAHGAAGCSPRWRARTGPRASSAGRARCPRARSATSSCTRSTCSPPWCSPAAAPCRRTARSTGWTCAASCSATPRARAGTPSCACRATGCRRSSGGSGRPTCSSRTTFIRPGAPTTSRTSTTWSGTRVRSTRSTSRTPG